ncbi:unnamed protein product [Notodromas monacha]|uniref:Protein MEMO1 n=1 Tax=Notodromas monacha TaxID=399045 RepID=A0A7R9BGD3_9CRUS|nr:unnamed protein product [Notodromas monacha]CAG0913667.1 unnamed protein product [Notodromas monacha]
MSARRATHAGSWYSSSSTELDRQLSTWLADTDSWHGPAKAIIAPHAGYRYSGACAAHAYKQVNPRAVRRVFILGPSHHVRLSGCALSPVEKYRTPLYDLRIHGPTYEELLQTGHFEHMSQTTDEDEHSIEMHLPYIAKVMEEFAEEFWIVPILVGSLNAEREALYGRILAPYLNAPDTLFVISSDFCHWGQRFRYTFYDRSWGQIYESIEKLDRMGMSVIEQLSLSGFTEYLKKYGNTICGRHPIGLLLNCIDKLEALDNAPKMSLKFLKYAQSNHCMSNSDSSVSYASAALSFFALWRIFRGMDENDAFCERVISDVMNALDRQEAVDEFDIIPAISVANRSPVILHGTKMALEAWAVPYIHKYACRIITNKKAYMKKDPEALVRATTAALLVNSGQTTMWNIRKQLIIDGHLKENQEMSFTALVLTRKQKTAQAFTQRQFLWKRWLARDELGSQRLDADLAVAAQAADRYPNNYHAWNHRNWVVHLVMSLDTGTSPTALLWKELEFSSGWIKLHVGDHSGMQYREMLLTRLASLDPNKLPEIAEKDLHLCGELIAFYPGHEALWNFRRFLVKLCTRFMSEGSVREGEEHFCRTVLAEQKLYVERHSEWVNKKKPFSDSNSVMVNLVMWSTVTPVVIDEASPPVTPSARCKHSACFLDGKLYLLGGRNGNMPLKDFWKYDLATEAWVELKPSGRIPPSLQESTMVAWQNQLYVFGGEVSFSCGDECPLWIYDIKCNVWRKWSGAKGDKVPKGRRGHTAVVFERNMYVYGGYQDLKGSSGEFWRFSFEKERWEELVPTKGCLETPPAARHNHSSVLHDQAMFILGGMTNLCEKDDFWKLDLKTYKWSLLRIKGGPGALHGHAAIRVQNSMLVFGGERQGNVLNELWCFHFATETWENLQLMGVKPAPRSQAVLLCPTSVWSAEEVRHHTTFDPDLLNVTAIFDTYSKNLQSLDDFVPTFCKHREARQKFLMQQRSLQLQETKLDDEEDEEEKWYQEFRKRRGVAPDAGSRRLHRVESFSSGSQNLRFFKDFSRISQMSLSRLSKYNSYSALSDDDDCSASEDCTSQDFSRSSMSSLVKSASINYFPRSGRSSDIYVIAKKITELWTLGFEKQRRNDDKCLGRRKRRELVLASEIIHGYCAACCRNARCRMSARAVLQSGMNDNESISEYNDGEVASMNTVRTGNSETKVRKSGSVASSSRRRPRSCGGESGVSADYPLSPTESFNSHQHLPYAASQMLRAAGIEVSSTVASFDQNTKLTKVKATNGRNLLIDLDNFPGSIEEQTSDYASVETDSNYNDKNGSFGYDNPNYDRCRLRVDYVSFYSDHFSPVGPVDADSDCRLRSRKKMSQNTYTAPGRFTETSVEIHRSFAKTLNSPLGSIDEKPVSRGTRAPKAYCEEFTSHQNVNMDFESHHEEDLTSHNYSIEMQDMQSMTSTDIDRELQRLYFAGREGHRSFMEDEDDRALASSLGVSGDVSGKNGGAGVKSMTSSKVTPIPQQGVEEMFVYLVGGREVGQIVAFRRPISVWKLDLNKCIAAKWFRQANFAIPEPEIGTSRNVGHMSLSESRCEEETNMCSVGLEIE